MLKVALFSLGRAPEALIPEAFLGQAFVYAVATRREQIFFASEAVAARNKNDDECMRAAARRALDKLHAKLRAELEAFEPEPWVHAFLADEVVFRDIYFIDRKLILLPLSAHSPDMSLARAHVNRHFETARETERLESPELPWNSFELQDHLRALSRPSASQAYDLGHSFLKNPWAELRKKKKILLHVCCGPDAAGVINQLKRDFEVVCFWYDPNIQPREEYDLRLEAFKKVAEIEEVPYVVGEYDVDRFFETIRGLEHTPEQGAKCSLCYDMRLERSAIEAKKLDCPIFATTLAISPHKVQEKLKNFGEKSAVRHGLRYYFKNFMKDEGFKKSVEYTRDFEIYRQDYCGCIYSLHEGGPQARAMADKLGLQRKGDAHVN